MDSKKLAAEKAVDWIKSGMTIGLGTGSTANWAIQKIAEKVKQGMQLKAVATSLQSEKLAREAGIQLLPFAAIESIDVTIDGADEIDSAGHLIKGGGGALLREKIVAYHTKTYIIVIDETKLVAQLGKFPLPVEIIPFASEMTVRKLEVEFGSVQLRQKEGKTFFTDNGNLIADLHCYPITDPAHLNQSLHNIPGVVETGLFFNTMISLVIIGTTEGEVKVHNGSKR